MAVTPESLSAALRDVVQRGVHLGHLAAGDRLGSIRSIARQTGVDERAVTRSYRWLSDDGLVEIHPRSGVFVGRLSDPPPQALDDHGAWLVDVLLGAWERRIPARRLQPLIATGRPTRPVRCCVVDAVEDVRANVSWELRHHFGIDATPVDGRTLGSHARGEGVMAERTSRALASADLVVTTVFHLPVLRRLPECRNTPIVVLALHPEPQAALERHLQAGVLTVVCADPGLVDRLDFLRGGVVDKRGEIRFVNARDRPSKRSLRRMGPVLLTRYAARMFGMDDVPGTYHAGPIISSSSARLIATHLVHLRAADGPLPDRYR